MRALLTGGIKAILAIAALSTAAHWALRVQREAPAPAPALASLPDPVTTGSIDPRRIDRPAPARGFEAKGADSVEVRAAKAPPVAASLDQTHLAALIASSAKPAPRPVLKAELKPTARIEARVETGPEPKRTEAKRTEAKRTEPKPAAGADARPPVKVADAKPHAKLPVKPEPKPDAKR